MPKGLIGLPAGAELAVAQHVEDLLESEDGARLVAVSSATGDFQELAAFLAAGLIHGVEVDVEWPRARQKPASKFAHEMRDAVAEVFELDADLEGPLDDGLCPWESPPAQRRRWPGR